MLDIQTFSCALKAKWIQKYLDCVNQGKWKLLFDIYLEKHGRETFSFNLRRNIISIIIQELFLNEILDTWTDLNFKDNPINSQ